MKVLAVLTFLVAAGAAQQQQPPAEVPQYAGLREFLQHLMSLEQRQQQRGPAQGEADKAALVSSDGTPLLEIPDEGVYEIYQDPSEVSVNNGVGYNYDKFESAGKQSYLVPGAEVSRRPKRQAQQQANSPGSSLSQQQQQQNGAENRLTTFFNNVGALTTNIRRQTAEALRNGLRGQPTRIFQNNNAGPNAAKGQQQVTSLNDVYGATIGARSRTRRHIAADHHHAGAVGQTFAAVIDFESPVPMRSAVERSDIVPQVATFEMPTHTTTTITTATVDDNNDKDHVVDDHQQQQDRLIPLRPNLNRLRLRHELMEEPPFEPLMLVSSISTHHQHHQHQGQHLPAANTNSNDRHVVGCHHQNRIINKRSAAAATGYHRDGHQEEDEQAMQQVQQQQQQQPRGRSLSFQDPLADLFRPLQEIFGIVNATARAVFKDVISPNSPPSSSSPLSFFTQAVSRHEFKLNDREGTVVETTVRPSNSNSHTSTHHHHQHHHDRSPAAVTAKVHTRETFYNPATDKLETVAHEDHVLLPLIHILQQHQDQNHNQNENQRQQQQLLLTETLERIAVPFQRAFTNFTAELGLSIFKATHPGLVVVADDQITNMNMTAGAISIIKNMNNNKDDKKNKAQQQQQQQHHDVYETSNTASTNAAANSAINASSANVNDAINNKIKVEASSLSADDEIGAVTLDFFRPAAANKRKPGTDNSKNKANKPPSTAARTTFLSIDEANIYPPKEGISKPY